MNMQQKSLDFFGIQAKILGLQRYLVMRLRESRHKHVLAGGQGSGNFTCRFCGEKFSSASSVRIGYCSYSANHKHQLAGQTDERQSCFCQYCGEKFSSPSSVRIGYCSYSENHKHALSSATEGKFFCKYCGEKFSSSTSIRIGYCLKNEKNHKHCLP